MLKLYAWKGKKKKKLFQACKIHQYLICCASDWSAFWGQLENVELAAKGGTM